MNVFTAIAEDLYAENGTDPGEIVGCAHG
jgi:hypothetical protein